MSPMKIRVPFQGKGFLGSSTNSFSFSSSRCSPSSFRPVAGFSCDFAPEGPAAFLVSGASFVSLTFLGVSLGDEDPALSSLEGPEESLWPQCSQYSASSRTDWLHWGHRMAISFLRIPSASFYLNRP